MMLSERDMVALFFEAQTCMDAIMIYSHDSCIVRINIKKLQALFSEMKSRSTVALYPPIDFLNKI